MAIHPDFMKLLADIEIYVDGIIEDLKETCKGDSTSAPENSAAEELKGDLEEVANFKGSRAEKLIMLFCKQMKLKYSRLTEFELSGPTIVRRPKYMKFLFRRIRIVIPIVLIISIIFCCGYAYADFKQGTGLDALAKPVRAIILSDVPLKIARAVNVFTSGLATCGLFFVISINTRYSIFSMLLSYGWRFWILCCWLNSSMVLVM